MEKAYLSLKLPAAQRMLMLDSPQATVEYVNKVGLPKWRFVHCYLKWLAYKRGMRECI